MIRTIPYEGFFEMSISMCLLPSKLCHIHYMYNVSYPLTVQFDTPIH